MVARLVCNEKVVGSNPTGSTSPALPDRCKHPSSLCSSGASRRIRLGRQIIENDYMTEVEQSRVEELLSDVVRHSTLTVGDRHLIEIIIGSGEVDEVSWVGFDLANLEGTLPQLAKYEEMQGFLGSKTDNTGKLLAPYTEEEKQYLIWEEQLSMRACADNPLDLITSAIITEEGLVITYESDVVEG